MQGIWEEHVPLNNLAFRDLMAGVCAPVTVVTTTREETPYGSTVSAFASLSLDPPMISVALDRSSRLLAFILQTKRLALMSSPNPSKIWRDFLRRAAPTVSVNRRGLPSTECRA